MAPVLSMLAGDERLPSPLVGEGSGMRGAVKTIPLTLPSPRGRGNRTGKRWAALSTNLHL